MPGPGTPPRIAPTQERNPPATMPMITRRGVGLAATAVAVFFVASATRVGWLHLADAVLWGILALSVVFPWLSIAGLRASRHVSVRSTGRQGVVPVEGDSVDLGMTVENPGVLPRFLVSAGCDSTIDGAPGSRHRFFMSDIPGRGRRDLSCVVEVHRRGRHRFGPPLLESSGPFGMFRRRKRSRTLLNLLVYPRWVSMRRVGLLDAAQGAAEGRTRSRVGGEVAGSRRYVFGDPMRLMHWRNTARTGRPTVKEFDAWADNAVTVALDVGMVQGEPGETTLDYAARLAASVSRTIIAGGGEIALMTGAEDMQQTADWRAVMKSLAVLDAKPGRSLGSALKGVQPGDRVLAVVWARDAASATALAALCRRGCSVAAVVLEGFASGDEAAHTLGLLRRAGAAVVACRRGALEEAVAAIERAHPGRARRTIRPRVETGMDERALAA